MKTILIFCLTISTAVAAPAESFMNAKAGLSIKVTGETKVYSFHVTHLKNFLCSAAEGTQPKCEWKALEGAGRHMLTRRLVDEVTGEESVHNYVLEQTAQAVFVRRWVVDGTDYGESVLLQLAERLSAEERAYKKKK